MERRKRTSVLQTKLKFWAQRDITRIKVRLVLRYVKLLLSSRKTYDTVIIERTILGFVLDHTTALHISFPERCTLTNKAAGILWRNLCKPFQRRQALILVSPHCQSVLLQSLYLSSLTVICNICRFGTSTYSGDSYGHKLCSTHSGFISVYYIVMRGI